MIKVGLLGAGRIGNVHARAVFDHDQSELAAISDVHVPSAETLATQYRVPARSSEDILNDPTIDAVIIATSTDTHSPLIEAATAAGKAVFCEKPVDLDLARAKSCKASADVTGQPVMVGFNRRFDPNFAALKFSFDAGNIGRGELLTITSFDPAPPPVAYIKVSGGMFRDMMIHDFDMANFIMGALPETISATGSSLVDPAIAEAGDIDTAVVTMTYSDGRVAVIKNSRRAAFGYDQRVELLGSTGMLEVTNVLENTLVTATEAGITSAKPLHFFLERYMPAYRSEWDAFVTAITTKATPPVTLEDGISALAMAEAASRSLARRQPVPLAEVL